MIRKTLMLAALAVMLLQFGCSREPGGDDIDGALARAYAENLSAERAALAGFGMDELLPEYVAAEKLACAASETGRGYACDVELTTRQFGETSTVVTVVRLVRGDNGWVVVE